MSLSVKSIPRNYINVYGLFGSFKIPNSNYIVKYFSTYANNRDKSSMPYLLLKELKPMRERVPANEIKDISSLLQRDLNDTRVANELVKYLLGDSNNQIAFFPAILGVLMPKEFITKGTGVYPKVKKTENEDKLIVSYEDGWIAEVLKDNSTNEVTPLGNLKIDPLKTDIVVLDGQHRANAFRVVCDAFEDRENGVYAPFYENVIPPDTFQADLPVTLIWFESPDQYIDPKLISRKLFVDVNNSAKGVSESRTILLNDKDPTALLTRFLYSAVAEKYSFSSSRFSLLHSGFDVDSDLTESSGNEFTLTTPQIMYSVMDRIFFGKKTYNALDSYAVLRDHIASVLDTAIFAEYFPEFRPNVVTPTNNDERRKIVKEEADLASFEKKFCDVYFPVFEILLNEWNFLKLHYSANEIIQKRRDGSEGDWNSELRKDVWDRIFCGGEGLYYSFKSLKKNYKSKNSKANDFFKAIDNISLEFIEHRANINKSLSDRKSELNSSFTSIRTKAFQMGYFVAYFQFYNEHNFDLIEAAKVFVQKLNKISDKGWVNIFTKLRPELIKETDPKQWPAYHKLILRIIQEKDEYYNLDENKLHSPEVKIFERLLDAARRSWAVSNGLLATKENYKTIPQETLKIWIESAKEKIKYLLSECEIKEMNAVDYKKAAKILFNREIEMEEED